MRQTPFTIRIIDRDRDTTDSHLQGEGVTIKIDPGSRYTGISVTRLDGDGTVHGLVGIEVQHRGHAIHEAIQARANYRKRRRSALRYRAPRFNNRTRPQGWLAPSLRHRVENVTTWITRISRLAPITGLSMELVRFDMQKHENQEISGVEYQHGTLFGYEVREYLLAKWGRSCAYCDARDVPLNIDHIQPKARGGSNRVSNLTLACIPCNHTKGSRSVNDFLANDPTRLARILHQAKTPLRDAAAVNTTRWALHQTLLSTGIPTTTGSGGLTKYNRTRFGLPKSHTLDALSVGPLITIDSTPRSVLVARSTGRGTYARTRPDKYGFPRLHLTRQKRHHGFQTGDHAVAVVTTGTKQGTYTGRVAVRTNGRFNITTEHGTVQGLHHRFFRLIQRADGYHYTRQEEAAPPDPQEPGLRRPKP